jgi:hypothetical protein
MKLDNLACSAYKRKMACMRWQEVEGQGKQLAHLATETRTNFEKMKRFLHCN